MFCPRRGSSQGDELKFCTVCGANLYAVRQVVDTREASQKFDWSKTRVAEMFMSGEEAQRRQLEMERWQGITPATRRYQEIKAGIITTSTGLGVAAVLFLLMEGIIRSGTVSPAAAEILGQLWIAGIIPVLVGIALIVNGYFVSRKIVELAAQGKQLVPGSQEKEAESRSLRPADTTEFVPSSFSVTEGTTKHLGHSNQN
jgi:hypothetical protein